MKVIIIGAGLAGLGAGLELKKRGVDFQILEASDAPGGLAKTDVIDDFFFDYTGHYLHVKTEDGIKDLLEDTVSFDKIKRESAVLFNHRILPYPIQYNLKNLDADNISKIISEVSAIQDSLPKSAECLEKFIENHFGQTLVNIFFKPYNEKLWGKPLNELPKDCLGKYFPKIDLPLLLKGCQSNTAYEGYNDYFYYPSSGKIGSMPQALAKKIEGQIEYNTAISRIDLLNKKCCAINGSEYTYDYLISSMPLQQLSAAIGTTYPTVNYKFSSLKNIRLIIKGQLLHPYHWLYIPEEEVPFYRIGFIQNVTTKACPAGCVSISLETEVTRCAQYTDKEISEFAVKYLEQFKLIKSDGIHFINSTVITPAYCYNTEEENDQISNFLSMLKESDITCVGRYGSWKYLSMEEAYLTGKHAAAGLLIPTPN